MMNDLSDLQDRLIFLAELGVKRALKGGAEEAEAFVSNTDLMSVNISNTISQARQGTSAGVGIRVVKDGRLGFAAASGIDEQRIEGVAMEALSVAKLSPLDPHFKQLPNPIKRNSHDGVIDKRILNLTWNDISNMLNSLIGAVLEYDKRIKSVEGRIWMEKRVFAVVNSRGIADSAKSVFMGAFLECVAAEQGKEKMATDFLFSRNLMDPTRMSVKVAERATKMLQAKPLRKSLKTTTVWENISIGHHIVRETGLLKLMLSTAVSARNVQSGKSPWEDKINEEVASEAITIYDDGQLPEGIATAKIDAEGVPTSTTLLIEKGVLKTFLYDSYSAFKEGKLSTGNAVRYWGEAAEAFLNQPEASTTNIVVEPGTRNLEELIEEVDEGILITDLVMGVPNSNPVTGDFSCVSRNAFLIKRGEISDPLEPITVAGNFFQAIKKVREIGRDSCITPSGKIPSIIIEDLTVSG